MTREVLDIDWEVLLSMPEWERQVASLDRTVACRIEVIDAAGIPVGDARINTGTVTMRGGGSEMWVAELAGSDPDWLPLDETDPLDSRSGNRVRVWWQEWIPELNGWGEVPMMTGWPHNPQVGDDRTVSWSITVRDSLLEAKRGGYGGAVVEVGGMTVDQALTRLFDTVAPKLDTVFPRSAVRLPTTYNLGENEPSKDWTAIAAMAGWTVWSDREGVIVAGPLKASRSVNWSEGAGCRITELKRATTTTAIINRVEVRSTNSDVSPAITAVAEDNDPGSPTYVGMHGPWVRVIESDAIASQQAADNLAKSELIAGLRPTSATTGKATPRPDLGWGDVIQLERDRVGVFGPHVLTEFQMVLPAPNTAPALMSVTLSPIGAS